MGPFWEEVGVSSCAGPNEPEYQFPKTANKASLKKNELSYLSILEATQFLRKSKSLAQGTNIRSSPTCSGSEIPILEHLKYLHALKTKFSSW